MANENAKPTKDLQVVSRPPTFRRCGYMFSAEPTVIPAADLTKEQRETLLAEKNLVVTEIDPPPPEPAEKPKK